MPNSRLTKSLLRTTDKYIEGLAKAGIKTVWDLISHFPRDFDDRTQILDSFSYINLKEKNTILVKLVSVNTQRTANNKLLIKAIIEDKDEIMAEAVWFNNKFLAGSLKPLEGKQIILTGKVKYAYGKLDFMSPDVEKDLTKMKGEILPIYPELNYIPSKWIHSKMKFLDGYFNEIKENLPKEILDKYNFIARKKAYHILHFPKNKAELEIAKKRLAYEELFHIQKLGVDKKYELIKNSGNNTFSLKLDAEFIKNILEKLPFELTNKQKISLFQILKDMEQSHAGNRLLEGDVGTGKTIVALIAAIHAIAQSEKDGDKIQVAVMAPTAILASQHFESMKKMLEEYGLKSELLIGATTAKNKEIIKDNLVIGKVDVIIGTHALIEDDVIFKNLGFVIVDEQHRFGVKQREKLELKFTRKNKEDNLIPHPNPLLQGEGTENEIKMYVGSPDYVGNLAKDLRQKGTESEKIFWQKVRNKKFNGYKIRRQVPFGRYIADFYIAEFKIIIEIDGSYHLGEYQQEYDKIRNETLEQYGLNIIRIKSEKIINNLDEVLDGLKKYIEKLPSPSRRGAGGEVKNNIQIKYPHILNMTATPIPRTLALTLYGDQDLSIIDEYPKGRKEIITKVVNSDTARQQVELFIKNELEKGRQVFWISPLVEQSEKMDLADAINTYESLVEVFSPFKVGLIHGKLKQKEKDEIMNDFSENKIQVLSATSVIEVGIDVPNASVICIEGAERFGLSQLHQFRGRVGRGEHQSHCYLFPSKGHKTDRLKAMERTNNGFELAEIDLEIRGPGEVYGVKQAGVPDLKLADLKDLTMVSQIREDLEELYENKD